MPQCSKISGIDSEGISQNGAIYIDILTCHLLLVPEAVNPAKQKGQEIMERFGLELG